MSRGSESGDRFRTAFVGGASGAAAFDGNLTNSVQAWMVPEDWSLENVPLMLQELMHFTLTGHLAWVVFPPQGFRL